MRASGPSGEDLLAERGIGLSYESIRRWVNHFGPLIAADLRKRPPRPHSIWHLDEVYLKIDGRLVYLWRAVDAEGEVLNVLVQAKRNKHPALKLSRSARIARSLGLYGHPPQVSLLLSHRSAACTIATSVAPESVPASEPVPPSRRRGVAGRPPSRRLEPGPPCRKPAPQESGALVNAETRWSRSSPAKRFHCRMASCARTGDRPWPDF